MRKEAEHREAGAHREKPSRRLPGVAGFVVALFVILPYTISYGDTNSTFTLVNRTQHYIHAYAGSTSYTFIAPGRSFVQQVDAPATVVVEVAYAPGQGIRGKATRTFEILIVTSHTNSTDCSNSSRGTDCSNNIDASSTVYPAQWDVTADDLAIGGEGGIAP